MQDKFLKARIPRPLYQELQQRAGETGQRLGTLVREILQRDAQVIGTEQALARIESALVTATTATAPTADDELHRALREMRLIVRELAMHANAQILSRVTAQLAAQAPAAGGAP